MCRNECAAAGIDDDLVGFERCTVDAHRPRSGEARVAAIDFAVGETVHPAGHAVSRRAGQCSSLRALTRFMSTLTDPPTSTPYSAARRAMCAT